MPRASPAAAARASCFWKKRPRAWGLLAVVLLVTLVRRPCHRPRSACRPPHPPPRQLSPPSCPLPPCAPAVLTALRERPPAQRGQRRGAAPAQPASRRQHQHQQPASGRWRRRQRRQGAAFQAGCRQGRLPPEACPRGGHVPGAAAVHWQAASRGPGAAGTAGRQPGIRAVQPGRLLLGSCCWAPRPVSTCPPACVWCCNLYDACSVPMTRPRRRSLSPSVSRTMSSGGCWTLAQAAAHRPSWHGPPAPANAATGPPPGRRFLGCTGWRCWGRQLLSPSRQSSSAGATCGRRLACRLALAAAQGHTCSWALLEGRQLAAPPLLLERGLPTSLW